MKYMISLFLLLTCLCPLQKLSAESSKAEPVKQELAEDPLVTKAKKEFEDLLFKFLNAACQGNVAELQACIKQRADIMDFPLVGRSGEAFCMALHLACESGHLEVVKALLEAGAQIDPRDHLGRTPLFIAAERGYTKIVELLLEQGASIEARNIVDVTPLHAAAWMEHLDTVNLLITKGANIHAECSYDSSPFVYGATASGYLDIAKAFIEKGAQSNVTDPRTGSTLLHLVAYHGYRNEQFMKLLLDRGADINAKDIEGMTPLFIAAHKKHKEIAAFLIKHGGHMHGKPYPTVHGFPLPYKAKKVS